MAENDRANGIGSFDRMIGWIFIGIACLYIVLHILYSVGKGSPVSWWSIIISAFWVLSGVVMFLIGNGLSRGEIWAYWSSLFFHGLLIIFLLAYLIAIRNLKIVFLYIEPIRSLSVSILRIIDVVFILYNAWFSLVLYKNLTDKFSLHEGNRTNKNLSKRSKLTFALVSADNDEEKYYLNGDKITIGRDRGNSIVLNDSSVSRKHAIIEKKKGQYFIKDLNSTNGILINGKAIKPGRFIPIENNNKIVIGNFTFVFAAEKEVNKKVTDEE